MKSFSVEDFLYTFKLPMTSFHWAARNNRRGRAETHQICRKQQEQRVRGWNRNCHRGCGHSRPHWERTAPKFPKLVGESAPRPTSPQRPSEPVTSLGGKTTADTQGKSRDSHTVHPSKFNKLAAKNFNQIFNLSSL